MNRQGWKLEYQKWRSFFSMCILANFDTYRSEGINKAHTLSNSIKCDAVRKMSHPAIYYALFNRHYTSRVRLITEGKYGIRCNMDLSPYQIEQHRLKAKGIEIDWTLCHKTKLARFSKC